VARIENDILTVKEVAEYLRIGERSVYKLIKLGRIPAVRILNKWRINKIQIDDIFKNFHNTKDGD
jgi:excisionase family DNA binding protein